MDFSQLAVSAATLASAAYGAAIAKGALYQTGTSAPTPAQINADLWETFRVFYAGMVSASGDPKDWPNGIPRGGKTNPPTATNTLPSAPSAN